MLVVNQSNKGSKRRPVYPEESGLVLFVDVAYPLRYNGLQYPVKGFWILESTDLFLIALPKEILVRLDCSRFALQDLGWDNFDLCHLFHRDSMQKYINLSLKAFFVGYRLHTCWV